MFLRNDVIHINISAINTNETSMSAPLSEPASSELPASPEEPVRSELNDPVYASLCHTMTSVLTALPLDPRGTAEDHAMHRHAAVAILDGLHPNDAVQHMFAARTAAAHFVAMECFRRAGLPDQPDQAFVRLLRLADGMERMSTRSLDSLKRCQSEADDCQRPALPGLAAAIAQAGRDHPMSSGKPGEKSGEKPASTPVRQAAAPAASFAPHHPTGQPSAAPAERQAPTAPCENEDIDPMSSEPLMFSEPAETAVPFDRQAWLAALHGMSPQEQHALADRMQALGQEPPLPVVAAG
jgi:hypothetical protein